MLILRHAFSPYAITLHYALRCRFSPQLLFRYLMLHATPALLLLATCHAILMLFIHATLIRHAVIDADAALPLLTPLMIFHYYYATPLLLSYAIAVDAAAMLMPPLRHDMLSRYYT